MAGLLAGKTVLVTGASRGLGMRLAEVFWTSGADVFLTARSSPLLEQLKARLASEDRRQRIGSVCVDLALPDSAEQIFTALSEFSRRLDVLVNNAAVLGPIGSLADNNWELWERTIKVNLLAPVALCRLAIARMRSQGGGLILNLSGGGATSPRPFFSAYAAAKAALVRATENIAAEFGREGIRANAIAPGAMNTEMMEAVLRAGAAKAGEYEYGRALQQKEIGGASPQGPAELALFLASPAGAGVNGRLISAVWDPWRNLEQHAAELTKSDIYTLRRIVPEDRGLKWT